MHIKEHTLMMVDFWKSVAEKFRKNPELRNGQVISNLMSELNREVFEKARTKGLDPFYDDLLIPDFMEFCQKELLN